MTQANNHECECKTQQIQDGGQTAARYFWYFWIQVHSLMLAHSLKHTRSGVAKRDNSSSSCSNLGDLAIGFDQNFSQGTCQRLRHRLCHQTTQLNPLLTSRRPRALPGNPPPPILSRSNSRAFSEQSDLSEDLNALPLTTVQYRGILHCVIAV